MKYDEFITELRRLRDKGTDLAGKEITHEEPEFRAWRHEFESVIELFLSQGEKLPGQIKSHKRRYRAMLATATVRDDIAAMQKDLSDTIIEVNFVLDNFAKYGMPDSSKVNKLEPFSPKEPEFPEKITLLWLAKHISIKYWLVAAGFIISVFYFGTKVGRSAWWQAFELEIINLFG